MIINLHEDHPSIRHLKNNVKPQQNPTTSLIPTPEKLAGVDLMLPKLVSLAPNYQARPVSLSINNSIKDPKRRVHHSFSYI